jgi:mono/diheme cytochrome c family protein
MTRRAYAWLALGSVVLAVAIGTWFFSFGVLSGSPQINPNDPEQVALGRQIYAGHCAMCHGDNLEGQPDWKTRKPNGRLPAPPHDASGHTWHHPDQQLMLITKKSLSAVVPGYESDMPSFEGVLTDGEIAAVLAYIESHWPNEIQERQRQLTRQAGG